MLASSAFRDISDERKCYWLTGSVTLLLTAPAWLTTMVAIAPGTPSGSWKLIW